MSSWGRGSKRARVGQLSAGAMLSHRRAARPRVLLCLCLCLCLCMSRVCARGLREVTGGHRVARDARGAQDYLESENAENAENAEEMKHSHDSSYGSSYGSTYDSSYGSGSSSSSCVKRAGDVCTIQHGQCYDQYLIPCDAGCCALPPPPPPFFSPILNQPTHYSAAKHNSDPFAAPWPSRVEQEQVEPALLSLPKEAPAAAGTDTQARFSLRSMLRRPESLAEEGEGEGGEEGQGGGDDDGYNVEKRNLVTSSCACGSCISYCRCGNANSAASCISCCGGGGSGGYGYGSGYAAAPPPPPPSPCYNQYFCNPGYYLTSGCLACSTCDAGTASQGVNNNYLSCPSCPSGKYTSDRVNCYANPTPAPVITSCPYGQALYQGGCYSCGSVYVCTNAGQYLNAACTGCSQCAAGTATGGATNLQGSCPSCPAGKYTPDYVNCYSVPTPYPISNPTPYPIANPTPKPIANPTPYPIANPTPYPIANPTPYPIANPTPKPIANPTPYPIANPTPKPIANPTPYPIANPTPYPTARPSPEPTQKPTTKPSPEPTTAYPSFLPSAAPTTEPTLRPSAVPSREPSVRPTAEPTLRPSAVPSREPSVRPTAEPTFGPSAVPTAEPTLRPSAVPTAAPTCKPSAAPTPHPSFTPTYLPGMPTPAPTAAPSPEPSALPSAAPTAEPTAAPSALPTLSPSPLPSSEPTTVPTAEPTTEPTAAPTAPSPEPTPAPTAPTPEPTSSPTFLVCPAGFSTAGNICTPCPPGFFCLASKLGVSEPLPCPAGRFSPGGVVDTCSICPYGKFATNDKSNVCSDCPGGRTTPIEGAATADYCLTLSTNYTAGVVMLAMSVAIFFHYMVQGRMFQIAFLRRGVRNVLVSRCRRLYKTLRKTLLEKNVNGAVKKDEDEARLTCAARARNFLLGAGVIVSVCIVFGVIWTMQSIFFNAFILWRSTIAQALQAFLNETFILRLREWVSSLAFIWIGIEALVRVLCFPIEVVVGLLETLHVDQILGNLNVTCSGSIAPIQLVFDVYIIGMIVTIVQSEFLLISLARKKLNLFYLETFAAPDFRRRVVGDFFSLFASLGLAGIIDTTALYKAFLRYLMTLLAIAAFFPVHNHTEACSATPPLDFDTALANLATACAYIFMYPTFYTIGRVCSPSSINKGLNSIILRHLAVKWPAFEAFVAEDTRVNTEELEQARGKVRLALQRLFSLLSFDMWIAEVDLQAIRLVKRCSLVDFNDERTSKVHTTCLESTWGLLKRVKCCCFPSADSPAKDEKAAIDEAIPSESLCVRLWRALKSPGSAAWLVVRFVLYDFLVAPCIEAAVEPFDDELGAANDRQDKTQARTFDGEGAPQVQQPSFKKSVFWLLEHAVESRGPGVTIEADDEASQGGGISLANLKPVLEIIVEDDSPETTEEAADMRAGKEGGVKKEFRRLVEYDVPAYADAMKFAWEDWVEGYTAWPWPFDADAPGLPLWSWPIALVALVLIGSGPGIVFSRRGLKSLVRVLDKYLSLAQVVLGVWDKANADTYEVHKKIENYCHLDNDTLQSEYDAAPHLHGDEKALEAAAPETATTEETPTVESPSSKGKEELFELPPESNEFRKNYDAMLRIVAGSLLDERDQAEQLEEKRDTKVASTLRSRFQMLLRERANAGDWTEVRAGDGRLRAVELLERFFDKAIARKWVSVDDVDELGEEMDELLRPEQASPFSERILEVMTKFLTLAPSEPAPAAEREPLYHLGSIQRDAFYKHFERCLQAVHLPMLSKKEIAWRIADDERRGMIDYQNMIGGMISTRAILFQIIQGGAFITVFASYLAATPFALLDEPVERKERAAILRRQLGTLREEKILESVPRRQVLARQSSKQGSNRSLSLPDPLQNDSSEPSQPYCYTVQCELVFPDCRRQDDLAKFQELQERLLDRCVHQTSGWRRDQLYRLRETVEKRLLPYARQNQADAVLISSKDVLESFVKADGETLAAKMPVVVTMSSASDADFQVSEHRSHLSAKLPALLEQTLHRYVKPQVLRVIKDVSDYVSLSRGFLCFFGLAQFATINVLYASVSDPRLPVKGVLYFIVFLAAIVSFFKYALRGVVWWGSYLLLAEGDLTALLDVVTCGRLGLWAARHPPDRPEKEGKELGASWAERAGGDSGDDGGGGEAGGAVTLASSQVALEGFDVIPPPGPSARAAGHSRHPPVRPTIPHAPYSFISPSPFQSVSTKGQTRENDKTGGGVAVDADEHDEGDAEEEDEEDSLLALIFPAKSPWRVVNDVSHSVSASAEAPASPRNEAAPEEAVAAEEVEVTDSSTVPEVERETSVSWFAAP